VITDATVLQSIEVCTRILLAQFKVRDNDRDDVQQEIALALWRARDRHKPDKSSWRAYSLFIARNAVRSFYRDAPLVGEHWGRYTREYHRLESLESMSHDIAVQDRYEYLELQEVLEPFSLRERQLIVVLLAGYSTIAASRMMGISETYTRGIMQRLRIKNSKSYISHHMDSQPWRLAA